MKHEQQVSKRTTRKSTRSRKVGGSDLLGSLMERGDIFADETRKAQTDCLLIAIKEGDAQAVENAIPHADLEAVGEYGFTPLCWAVYYGNVDAIYALINAGANMHHRAERGMMPVHLAASRAYPEALRTLFESGADMDARCGFGFTPLKWAEMRSWNNAPMLSVMAYIAETRQRVFSMREQVSQWVSES